MREIEAKTGLAVPRSVFASVNELFFIAMVSREEAQDGKRRGVGEVASGGSS